ncbi:MAG TPA: lipoyl synthase [Deltaproteobacteria bacterium]|nr:MAG: lipoyl synthase [Deltaproteobacteria bacterium GWA2_45_12]HBF13335.1 lipoyl synthase [Deltaproteobacteria bacterium]
MQPLLKPPWLKKRLDVAALTGMQARLRGLTLHSVCEEARCPNISECFSKGVATVMIMGDTCTRACKFCAVATGRPKPLDPNEPENVAKWAGDAGLKHIVITSVDRDDLPDLGATHFGKTVQTMKEIHPLMIVEVLTPDFQGKGELIDKVCQAEPKIYNHNLETVRRLTPGVRSAARYDRSLQVIKWVKKNYPNQLTKSGLMLGLGETEEEILESMQDLLNHGCDMLTLGQYLQPTLKHLPVKEYIPLEKFEGYHKRGLQMGFKAVFAGPFVRSSYLADELYEQTFSV